MCTGACCERSVAVLIKWRVDMQVHHSWTFLNKVLNIEHVEHQEDQRYSES